MVIIRYIAKWRLPRACDSVVAREVGSIRKEVNAGAGPFTAPDGELAVLSSMVIGRD